MLALGFVISVDSVSAGKKWAKQLKNDILSEYTVTKTTMDHKRIVTPGTVFVSLKDGLALEPADSLALLPNNIMNGEISQEGGFSNLMVGRSDTKQFSSGTKVYLKKVQVKKKYVALFFLTVDSFNIQRAGSTLQSRYYGALYFKFPGQNLSIIDFPQIKQAIEEILIPEDRVPEEQPKTVELGQTSEEVKTILGNPKKVLKAGSKEIFVYEDIKIVFIDGKVADLE